MKFLYVIIFTFFSFKTFSQTYLSLAPSLTNSAGTIADKGNMALELGQQWDVFSLGIDIGKTTFSKVTGRDTTKYVELRPNLNIFQEGKFTNTFTAGIGYVFGGEEDLLTEVTYGIEYSLSDNLHLNAFFGQFYYSGKFSASNVSFFGVSAAYYFSPVKSGSLIKNKDK